MRTVSHDILIIGAGVAGQRAAIEARNQNMDVGVVSKIHPTRTPSIASREGINAVLEKNDSWKAHARETIYGSDFLADQDAAELVCKDAPALVRELESWGTVFSRTPKGEITQRKLNGNSKPRACYSNERTGHAVIHTLYDQLSTRHPTLYTDYFALSLIVENNRCHGAILWDVPKGKIVVARARATLLATGGYTHAFARSTNVSNATGDGHALTLNAGLPLEDMEFTQFHPTVLHHEKGIVMNETLLNEGAQLYNAHGERFMKKYAPQQMEHVPHDLVSRAIATEISLGKGCGEKKDYIHLDAQHVSEKTIQENVPRTLNVLKKHFQLDLLKQTVPISPAAHFGIGGIPTDIHTRVTKDTRNTPLEGLYAAGEAACVSTHGASSLSGNTLAEALVFGRIAGQKMAEYVRHSDTLHKGDYSAHEEKALSRIEKLLTNTQGGKGHELTQKLQTLMNTSCGVLRNHSTLTSGLRAWKKIHTESQKIHVEDKSTIFNTDLLSALESQNLTILSQAILSSARERTETRGCHIRTDYTQRDDKKWLKHSLAFPHSNSIRMDYKPVVIKGYTPERRHY